MTMPAVSFRQPVLAWSVSAIDEARFRRLWRGLLAASLLGALVAGWLPRPERPPEARPGLSAPMAKLLEEQRLAPPPAPRPAPAAEKPAPDKAAERPPAEKDIPARKEPRPRNETPNADQPPVPEARRPIPGRAPGEVGARQRAAGVGLLAMKDQLAAIHGAPTAVQLQEKIHPGPGVGVATGPGVGAGTQPGLPDRALITSNATGGSGGINTAALSRDSGGGGLAGRSTTLVEGVAGGGGGGGPGGGGGSATGGKGNGTGVGGGSASKGGAVQRGHSGKASRSLEEIRLVFERHKGAIYAIYNRALRDDASLQGKVVVELRIAPTGNVSGLRLVSSELKTPELEAKLLARIRQFDFGAKDVDEMVVSWPLDFLPS
ncbi:AgmX/PglI C-terminal domain-containing protein [Ideonella sp. 4Y11]|uniref:AgmX/PglI C-terminal domain-containing protein n=2 Tax=Ideonella aquatica TaxID=2824119 RepID=A0A940YS56_9BURK|nr:AgmX/PglI C-terminal domain-containing protein [Ideonella aquatica]